MAFRIGRIVLLALALLATPREAAAHAVLLESVPADGATLAASPGEIRLVFNEPVAPIAIKLLDASGNEVADIIVKAVDRTVTLRFAGTLSTGSYVVSYRVTSQDAHAVAGSVLFSIGEAVVRPAPTATAVDGWRIAVAVNRFLWIGLSLTAAGLAMFLLLCGTAVTSDTARRLERWLRAYGFSEEADRVA
jgi:copper transport protein